jgi:hypothetical protein
MLRSLFVLSLLSFALYAQEPVQPGTTPAYGGPGYGGPSAPAGANFGPGAHHGFAHKGDPCMADIQKIPCKPGPGISKCLDDHEKELSPQCRSMHNMMKNRGANRRPMPPMPTMPANPAKK